MAHVRILNAQLCEASGGIRAGNHICVSQIERNGRGQGIIDFLESIISEVNQ